MDESGFQANALFEEVLASPLWGDGRGVRQLKSTGIMQKQDKKWQDIEYVTGEIGD